MSARNKAMADAWMTGLVEAGKARGELRADLNTAVVTGLLTQALGEGMLDQMARALGLSLAEYLANPDATQRLSEDELRALVRSVIDLFRHGADAPGGAA